MRKSTAILSAALLASVTLSLWLYSELRDARANGVELARQLASVDVSRPASHRIDAPSSNRDDAARSPSASAIAASTTDSKKMVVVEDDEGAVQARLMKDPRYREARREQQRLAYAPRRKMLVDLLGFTPAQADAVIDLQLDRDAKWSELANIGSNGEPGPDLRTQIEGLEKDHQNQLRALLGEDKRLRLESYMESRPTRIQVDEFRTELSEANGLRDDQVEPLIAALHAERARMRSDMQEFENGLISQPTADDTMMQRYSERQLILTREMNARMHSAASSILTNEQLAALDAMLKRDYARLEAQQRTARIESNLRRSAPADASASN